MHKCLSLFCLGVTCLLWFPVALSADFITYHMSGVLEEGGEFSGTFVLDTDATDLEADEGRGEFELLNINMDLINTGLFASGTSGTATIGQYFQNEFSDRAVLAFLFESQDQSSNVFTEIFFEPFDGDGDVLEIIDPDLYSGGYFDGSGQSDIVRFELTVVPEPQSLAVFGIIAGGIFARRSRRR